MAILFLVVSLVGMIAFYIARSKRDDLIRKQITAPYSDLAKEEINRAQENDKYWFQFSTLFGVFTTIFIFSLIAVCVLSFSVFTGSTIDNKISMYEEENAKIEGSISTIVQGYMDFESDTYSNLKNTDTDAMSLISLYPELKSDTLVQQQIQVYLDNNTKIKRLKEEKINVSKSRWLLYFGS